MNDMVTKGGYPKDTGVGYTSIEEKGKMEWHIKGQGKHHETAKRVKYPSL